MRKIIFYFTLFLMNVTCAASFNYPNQLTGNYHCASEPPNHQSFTCEMKLQKTQQTYQATAYCDDQTAYQGTGIYDASKQQLAVIFVNDNDKNDLGLIVWQVGTQGKMNSTWTHFGDSKIAKGFCQRKF